MVAHHQVALPSMELHLMVMQTAYSYCLTMRVCKMIQIYFEYVYRIEYIVVCHLQGAPCYGGVRTCGGLKSGLPTLQGQIQCWSKEMQL